MISIHYSEIKVKIKSKIKEKRKRWERERRSAENNHESVYMHTIE